MNHPQTEVSQIQNRQRAFSAQDRELVNTHKQQGCEHRGNAGGGRAPGFISRINGTAEHSQDGAPGFMSRISSTAEHSQDGARARACSVATVIPN